MRRLATLILSTAMGLGLATAAAAATLEWSGTLIVNMPVAGEMPPFVHTGTGVATVNGSAGGIGHINTITLHHGLSFTGGNNVPEVRTRTPLMHVRATGLRVGGTPYSNPQSFNGISGGPPLGSLNTGRPPGRMKLCFIFPDCRNHLPIPFGATGGQAIGVGGMLTVNTFSKGNGFKLSMQAAPWTIGLASIRNVTATTETPNGAISTYTYTKTIQGFAHGPASGTSNTATISGVLQLVTPVRLETNLGAPDRYNAGWFQVTLHFIPEPSAPLLLGSGAAGLLLLGRKRMRG